MTQVGRYLLLDRLAVGGMAEIYRAKTFGVEGFEKIIALKRILPSLADDHDFIEMFIEEAKIAGQLNHANIASIHELGKLGETHFIAMEYVWGKDLRQVLSRLRKMKQPMPPPMAAWIGAKMLDALDYAHRKRGVDGRHLAIIHRDISPQNVLVSYDGLVKVIDFGIAKAASRATQTQAGVVKGKLGYMSPEQVTGRTLDHRSDVFGVSICMYEMLAGRRLFKGSDIDVIDAVRRAAAPPLSDSVDVPKELERIVHKGLAREVDDRYATAGDMHEELMRFIAMSGVRFGTSELSRFMRTAFAGEMVDERAHLERLSQVGQAGELVVSDQPAPSAEDLAATMAFDGEDTVVTELPVSPPEVSVVELSQLVIVEEVWADRAEPSAPNVVVSEDAANAPALPVPSQQATLHTPPATVGAPAPLVPGPAGAAPLYAGASPSPGPWNPGVAPPPRVSADSLSPASQVAAAPTPRRKRRLLPLVFFLSFLIAAAVGFAVWFFVLGGASLLAG